MGIGKLLFCGYNMHKHYFSTRNKEKTSWLENSKSVICR